jgi:putative ABC transport system permease protein
MILLSPWDLALAAVLVLLLAATSYQLKLGIAGQMLVAALRTTVQLLLIGLVLKTLFEQVNLWFMVAIATFMLLVAGREVMARQKYRLAGGWSFGVGSASILLSSFSVALIALTVVVRAEPWYTPQYLIPLLGMILGNSMNGVALSVDRLTQAMRDQKAIIETRLSLGQGWCEAVDHIRRDSMRSGMIPIINAMAAAGLVSLPGMMTGQILAGSPPVEAVKYQIMIMFLITASSGFGTLAAVHFTSRRLFDERQRLRLDRLRSEQT